ncbi:hypothetical protein F5Y15DRAFT_374421 [Xylariaceae sp. FL0016]|nr:hypothetical protein F5Y15DRAFT_374421 [Xylariaceae sp. FL0016]
MASDQPGRTVLSRPRQQQQQQPHIPPLLPSPPPPPAATYQPEKASTSPPVEFRGFDFFAKRDLNELKNASRAYFAPTAAAAATGAGKTGDPASWLGDETPPATPQPTLGSSTIIEGRFPIPPNGKSPRSERRILGLRRSWFWALLVSLILLIIVAIAVGVGVGTANNRSTAAATDGSSSSSSGTSATSTLTDSATVTTTATATASPTNDPEARLDCPAVNGTTYQVPGSTKRFLRICGVDYSGDSEATDIGNVQTETMLDCMKNCAGTANCTGCGWGYLDGDSGTEHTCWLKSGLKESHEADPSWAFAVLL